MHTRGTARGIQTQSRRAWWLRSETSGWFAVCFNRDNNAFIGTVSDETRLSSLIIESDNVMPQRDRLCEMAIEMHQKVIGRSLIYYWPFAQFVFHTNGGDCDRIIITHAQIVFTWKSGISFIDKIRECKKRNFAINDEVVFIIVLVM